MEMSSRLLSVLAFPRLRIVQLSNIRGNWLTLALCARLAAEPVKVTMRSHFLPPPGAAATCAVASALAMLNGTCSAQSFVAADYATNSTYASDWTSGQNGGYGFGPWSF